MSRHTRSQQPALPKPGQVALHKLPPLLRRLVRSLGEAAAYRLAESYGGTPINVPHHVQAEHIEHPVAQLIGPEAWMALVRDFGPDRLQLPKVDALIRQVRHERVRELAHDARLTGRPLSTVALATNYSLRQVHNILGIDPPEGLQGDLFAGFDDDAELEAEAAEPAAADPVSAHNPFSLGKRA